MFYHTTPFNVYHTICLLLLLLCFHSFDSDRVCVALNILIHGCYLCTFIDYRFPVVLHSQYYSCIVIV